MKVCELSGSDVVMFDDAADVFIRVTKGVKCKGRLSNNQGRCPFSYYFEDVKE